MKPEEIHVGKTYQNRGKGKTHRKVISITKETEKNKPPWYSENPRPDDKVVKYQQNECQCIIYLKSFASWAGKEV